MAQPQRKVMVEQVTGQESLQQEGADYCAGCMGPSAQRMERGVLGFSRSLENFPGPLSFRRTIRGLPAKKKKWAHSVRATKARSHLRPSPVLPGGRGGASNPQCEGPLQSKREQHHYCVENGKEKKQKL